MRSVFDQYTQPENKVTHALMTALAKDAKLLGDFVRWVDGEAPRGPYLVTEQQVPGNPASGEESESRGLPDGCIWSSSAGYALLIESKVQSDVSQDQLRRHLRTAARHGYESVCLLLITVDRADVPAGIDCTNRLWSEIYEWMGSGRSSVWSAEFRRYLEVFETKADKYEIRGTMTMFDGIRFDNEQPYTYHEAKRLLRLVCDSLQQDQRLAPLGIDRDGSRRSAITGLDGELVWDFIPISETQAADQFTQHPHLTLGISRTGTSIAITVPNNAKGVKRRMRDIGSGGFASLLKDTAERLGRVVDKYGCGRPSVLLLQRHYRSQRSAGIEDAQIEFDLRVLLPDGGDGIVHQPLWSKSAFELLSQKRGNLQLQIRFDLPHTTDVVRSKAVLDVLVDGALAMQKFLEAFR